MKYIKYFLQYCFVVIFFSIFKILGPSVSSNLGGKLFEVIGPIFRSKNIIKKNLKIAMTNIGSEEITKISKLMWNNYGRVFAEYMFIKDFRFNKLGSNIQVEGQDILENLKKNININDGARELVKTMNMNGSITVLVSGGFTFLTEYLKELLGFKHTHANTLQIIQKEFQKFEITGKVEGPILDKKAKLEYLNKYVKKYNLNYKDTICVGDGANDIEMIKHAGLGVSYYGKSTLKKEANLHFNNTNLLGLLYAQGYTDSDIFK